MSFDSNMPGVYSNIVSNSNPDNSIRKELMNAVNEYANGINNKITDLESNNTSIINNINNINEQVNNAVSQLAEKATKTEVAAKADQTALSSLQTQVTNIGNGSPKGTYATLTALQTAFPTGTTGVYIVTADGKWYYWNGTAWTAGGTYQSTGLSDGSVSFKSTDFLTTSGNLFDYTTATVGYYLGSGQNVTANANYSLSDYIPVEVSTTYATNNQQHVTFYDMNKTFISTVNVVPTFTTPANCAYIRIDIPNVTIANSAVMVIKGNTLPSAYVPVMYKFKKKLEIDTSSLSIGTSNTTFFKTTSNLFDLTTIIDGYVISIADGTLVANSEFFTSDFISVSSNTVYANNNSNHVAYYDANKTFISTVNVVTSFTTPANCAYIRVDSKYAVMDKDKVMVTQGSVLPSYIPRSQLIIPIYDQFIKYYGWKGKLWNAVGDSITKNNNYQPIVSQALGLTYNNYGISSSTVAVNNTYLQSQSMVEKVCGLNGNTAYGDADLWTIFGGVNDWYYNTPVGDMTSTDNTTFYGALKTICANLMGRSNNPRVILFTMLQSNRNGDNGHGVTMQNYRQAIKDVGDYYSIPVLDLYAVGGINPVNLNKFTADGVHPNSTGTPFHASKIISAIKAL